MPEATSSESLEQTETVEAGEDLLASKMEADAKSASEEIPQNQSQATDTQTDDKQDDNSELDGDQINQELGIDSSSLPTDPEALKKHWHSAYNRKAMEFADEKKVLEDRAVKAEGLNSRVHEYLRDPDVLRVLKRKNPLDFQGVDVPGSEDDSGNTAGQIDPESKKVLDSYMAPITRQLEKQTQISNALYQELQLVQAAQNNGGKIANGKRDQVMQKMREHPTLKVDEAIKLVTFDDQQGLGAKKQVDQIRDQQNKRVLKPGASGENSTAVKNDADMDTEAILQDEMRRHGIMS